MDLNLRDKTFIISGSSRGIGKGIAEVLLEEGALCALTGRDEKSLMATYESFQKQYPDKVLMFKGDLNQEKTLKDLKSYVLSEWPKIDGVVANAGAVKPVDNWDIPDHDWEWYFEANFKVAYRFIKTFTPQLIDSQGSIVVISSIAGIEEIGAPLPYSNSKAALTMFAKGLARQLGDKGVRVNTIAPGNVLFPGGNWDRKRQADPKAIDELLEKKVPLKKFGAPADIGNMAAFLLSQRANFITGSCFVVDGGQTVKHDVC